MSTIANELRKPADTYRIANKVLAELAKTFNLDLQAISLSVGIGIAFFPDHGEDIDALIQSADQVMYNAKISGKNQLSIYGE